MKQEVLNLFHMLAFEIAFVKSLTWISLIGLLLGNTATDLHEIRTAIKII